MLAVASFGGQNKFSLHNDFFIIYNDSPGVVLNKFLCGKVPPRGPTPYPFMYHFHEKGAPFVYLQFY